MTDINNSPVPLPAGSFEYDALKKGLETAAKAKPEKYDDAVAKAIADAGTFVMEPGAKQVTPGYVVAEVENKDLGIVETTEAYDPKQADKAADAQGEQIAPQPTTPADTKE